MQFNTIWFVIVLQFTGVLAEQGPVSEELAQNISKYIKEQSKILDDVLANHDKRFIPAIPGQPLDVQLWLDVVDILKVADMEIELVLFIKQSWYDPRLVRNSTWLKKLKVRDHLLDKIWLPDIRLVNLKEEKRYDKFGGINMNIYPDGKVYYSQVALVKLDCPMKFYNFPMDRQTCVLTFASYAYGRDLLRYSLGKETQVRDFHLPEYDFAGLIEEVDENNTAMVNAKFSLVFQRRAGYYVLQIFIPATFLVILSWLSFLMECSDIADRLALLITMILSIVFLLGAINQSIPHVSYAKASDLFVIVSFSFIFLALFESMLVYRLHKMEEDAEKKTRKPSKRRFLWFHFQKAAPDENTPLPLEHKDKNGGCVENDNNDEEAVTDVHPKPKKRWSKAALIDKICIFAVPTLYFGFTAFYWSYYKHRGDS